jgi:hypothetical protein
MCCVVLFLFCWSMSRALCDQCWRCLWNVHYWLLLF